jgi:hypothetical protein
MLVIGFKGEAPDPAVLLSRIEQRRKLPGYAEGLRRSGTRTLPELLLHELVPVGALAPGLATGRLHTLLHPLLSDTAGRAFFEGQTAPLPFTGWGEAGALGQQNSLLRRFLSEQTHWDPDDLRARLVRTACVQRADQCLTLAAEWLAEAPDSPALAALLKRAGEPGNPLHGKLGPQPLGTLASFFAHSDASSGSSDTIAAQSLDQALHLYLAHYYHGAPFDPESFLALWDRCTPADECARGREVAESMVHGRTRWSRSSHLAADSSRPPMQRR